jgi:hypothetical protein
MKRITLLKTTLAASIAVATLMALAGCVNVNDHDHHDPNLNHPDDHHDDHHDDVHVDDHN